MLKKILAVVMVLAMVLCFAGCAAADKDDKKEDKNTLTITEGKLVMATNAEFPPYEYHEDGKIIGIDAEVAALIAKELGLELEIADVDFDSIIPGVQQKKYDMGMAGMTVTDERLEKVNFSSSYAKGVQVVIVKEGGNVATIDDIEGKKIGVQQGTTGDIYASDTPENGGYGEESVVRFQNGALAVEGLKTGKVDCVIIDNEPAKAYVAANEGLKILETEFANEDYAICFAKENTELQKKVNDALVKLIENGEVQKIVDKYIKAD